MTQVSTERFRKICFVRTGDRGDAGAFARALRLSEETQAELSIVSVVEEPPPGLRRLLASWGPAAETTRGEEVSADVEALVEVARRQNVEVTSEILRGPAFLEISRKVLRDAPDLLIKAAQSSKGVRRVLFGHMDRQLIRKCSCPVWIDKPSLGIRHDRILAAVDPAPFQDDPAFDPVREELNMGILEFAVLLAQAEEAELHVLHVWSFDLETPLRSRAGLSDEAVTEVGESIRKKHAEAVQELVRPFWQHIARVHLLKGDPGEEIPRLAMNEFADVVVMGTLCRSGIGGLLIGNTAETVLDQLECSIVALKPPGFVSPVRSVGHSDED